MLGIRNCIAELRLASIGAPIESLFPFLLSGCLGKLRVLDVSGNRFVARSLKGKEARDYMPPSAYGQFLSCAEALELVDLSETKAPPQVYRVALEALSKGQTPEPASNRLVDVRFAGNELGWEGAPAIALALVSLNHVRSIDLSDNDLGTEGTISVVRAIAEAKPACLSQLLLGRNYKSQSAETARAIGALADMIADEGCRLRSLNMADSQLREHIVPLLDALTTNECLLEVDLSGNMFGDHGAAVLAKALAINRRLATLHCDNNDMSLRGLRMLSHALDRCARSPACPPARSLARSLAAATTAARRAALLRRPLMPSRCARQKQVRQALFDTRNRPGACIKVACERCANDQRGVAIQSCTQRPRPPQCIRTKVACAAGICAGTDAWCLAWRWAYRSACIART